MRDSKLSHGFNGLRSLLCGVAVASALAGQAGCFDTELKACYASDECSGGQVCTVDGRCATPGGAGDAGLDAGLDTGPRDGGGDGPVRDGEGLPDISTGDGQVDGALPDVAVTDLGVAEVGPPDGLLPDQGAVDAGLPSVTCQVSQGDLVPERLLRPDPFGFAVVVTGADRVVEIVARSPNAGEAPRPGDGLVLAHCAQISRIDRSLGATQLELGAIPGFSGGRPAVQALVAGGRLHVGWWNDEPLQPDQPELPQRRIAGVSLDLDANGCPVSNADRQEWSVVAHRYSADFALAWLRGQLYVSVDLPVVTESPRLYLVPAEGGAPERELPVFQYGGNHIAAVSARDGETLNVFASVTPASDALLVHSRIGFDEVGILRLDANEDDAGSSALDVARLVAAVAADDGRFGVLAQELPAPNMVQPGCQSEDPEQPPNDETNGTPQPLVFQIVEPGRDPEVVYQVYGTPMTATGDPLYGGLAWNAALQRYAIAFSSQHGSANQPELNGIRLALLDTEANVTDHLEMARYAPTCQTVTHRPLVNATAEGFLVTWLHGYDHLRHTRVICRRTDQE